MLEAPVVFRLPLVIDIDLQADTGCLDVRIDLGIERVVLRVRMLGDEGIDLLREALDAVSNGHAQMAGLHIVGLHLRIRRTRSLLRARKAQEGDYRKKGKGNQTGA